MHALAHAGTLFQVCSSENSRRWIKATHRLLPALDAVVTGFIFVRVEIV